MHTPTPDSHPRNPVHDSAFHPPPPNAIVVLRAREKDSAENHENKSDVCMHLYDMDTWRTRFSEGRDVGDSSSCIVGAKQGTSRLWKGSRIGGLI
ncbi:unnamed protein product [Sphenostylis stenocarpa]|uniref:Uncharacterized protein n=1 Tax=Sphenostylis stenocarpa TaxID=92480 RepID=A0AA86TB99_9FABA|nr:unnamed protein product [Sphenostylis stenocarpa]